MKKQIDPNLDNLIEDEILSDLADTQLDEKLDLPEKDSSMSLVDENGNVQRVEKKEADNTKLSIETVDKGHRHHHHSSSHHSSSSSHSSSSHHHSSSSHHSSGSHHHSSGHHSSSSHHSSKKKKKKKSNTSTAVKIAIGVLIFLLLIVFAVVGTFFYLEHSGKNDLTSTAIGEGYEETIEYKGSTYKYNKDIVSIAFIGVDKRELGLQDDLVGTAGQADADIILTINTKTGNARAIAIPRDTMVDVDLYSVNNIFLRTEQMQLCLSYAYGNGTDTSAANVTTSISRILYNVPISKYFALDLDGIAPLNDAIGGVTLTSIRDFNDVGIKAGDEIHLSGDLTEKYVRDRDTDTVNASLNRTARQTQYIKAFVAQLAPAVMSDFNIVNRLYSTATKYSTTNISLSNATYLATLLLSQGMPEFETITLEGEMKASDKIEYADFVYAEFYPDEDKLMEVVLDTFYTKVN